MDYVWRVVSSTCGVVMLMYEIADKIKETLDELTTLLRSKHIDAVCVANTIDDLIQLRILQAKRKAE